MKRLLKLKNGLTQRPAAGGPHFSLIDRKIRQYKQPASPS